MVDSSGAPNPLCSAWRICAMTSNTCALLPSDYCTLWMWWSGFVSKCCVCVARAGMPPEYTSATGAQFGGSLHLAWFWNDVRNEIQGAKCHHRPKRARSDRQSKGAKNSAFSVIVVGIRWISALRPLERRRRRPSWRWLPISTRGDQVRVEGVMLGLSTGRWSGINVRRTCCVSDV